jgi:hypothetical protein
MNHADGIGAIDLFMVPTISLRLLYGLLMLRRDPREMLWLTAGAHPMAERPLQAHNRFNPTGLSRPSHYDW